MRNFRLSLALGTLFLALPLGCGAAGEEAVREPAYAGSFYPEDEAELSTMVDGFVDGAEIDTLALPRVVVVPHAGYVYSGATAGYAYRLLKLKADDVRRVIVIAPTHAIGFEGVIVNERSYRTPLGTYRCDRDAIAKLKGREFLRTNSEIAETREHSDEVQVPFLQRALPRAKMVSVIVGDLDAAGLEATARAISSIVDERTVIVVSSDFTHYGKRFGYAPKFKEGPREGVIRLDKMAIELILDGDVENFLAFLVRTHATICGRKPITLALKVLELNGWPSRGRLLRYTTSGELTGDYEGSVSYAAIALGAMDDTGKVEAPSFISREEERTLLKLARRVLTRFVNDGVAEYPDAELADLAITGNLKKEYGVFVTLHKEESLRGCIGHIQARLPLYRGVIENTMNAAARDPRFDRVARGEDGSLKIEISVMSPLMAVDGPEEIVVGRDGVVLSNGPYTGVFLPQVPVEQNWDRTMYLEQLGLKARMGRDAYKQKGTELKRFIAQVFHEE